MLTLATFNLCNLQAATSAARLARLGAIIARDLAAPDIIAVQEIGATTVDETGRVPASASYRVLVEAIAGAGGPAYDFREVAPWSGQEGGLSGLNIRTGLMFNPQRVEFVDRAASDPTVGVVIDTLAGRPALKPNPGRIAPHLPAFAGDVPRSWIPSRKALAAEFRVAGQPLFVVVCHLKSMRGRNRREQDYAKKQRHAQAAAIHDFTAALLAREPRARLVVLGDMNDVTGSKTLDILKGHELINVLERIPKRTRYTHRQGNQPQTLDHVLVSAALAPAVAVRVAHVNSDFPPELQASDHDPVWVELALGSLDLLEQANGAGV